MNARETALKLLELGHRPIPVKTNIKQPYGDAWQQKVWTPAQLEEHYDRYPDANIGVLLGPVSGLVDLEFDGPESEQVFNQLFPNLPATVSYRSNRSVHRLFNWHPLLVGCANVVNLNAKGEKAKKGEPSVEGRIGGGDGCQSLLPPSVVAGDMRHREYINDWTHPLADLPDEVAKMFACPAERTEKAKKENRLGKKVKQSWDQLLEAAGGKPCGEKQWTRPGKESGVSAALWKAKDGTEILHVFTSKWPLFEEGGNYNLFTVYATVMHDGDFAAAKKAVDPTTTHLLTSYSVETFRTPGNDAYVTFPVGDHWETRKIDSNDFKLWLQNRFWKETGEPANADALNQAVSVYKSRALFESPTNDVHVRVCATDKAIYVDLCDDEWQVIEITASTHQVLKKSPVKFRRPKGSLPLPEPDFNGKIEELRPFLNVSDSDFQLICLVLTSWLYFGPYVILLLESHAGSAKTSTLKFLRNLIDPNKCVARFTPKDTEDFFLAASNSYIFTLDNLSKLPEWLADALCILSTGGGLSLREFYQQDDERIMDAMRPSMLTSIVDLSTRSDFLRRAVVVHLLPITDFKTLDDLTKDFNADHSKILGALCKAVQVGLEKYSGTPGHNQYCMPNFVRWCEAAETGFGWELGTFDELYNANRQEVVDLVSSNAVAQAILQIDLPFKGKMKELAEKLSVFTDPGEWKNSPQVLSGQVKRLVGAIPGIEIEVKPNRVTITDNRAELATARKTSEATVSLATAV